MSAGRFRRETCPFPRKLRVRAARGRGKTEFASLERNRQCLWPGACRAVASRPAAEYEWPLAVNRYAKAEGVRIESTLHAPTLRACPTSVTALRTLWREACEYRGGCHCPADEDARPRTNVRPYTSRSKCILTIRCIHRILDDW